MPYQKNLLEYLIASAERCPDKTAFYDDEETFSFARLWRCARGIGTALVEAGAPVNRPVAVLVDRTAQSVAGMMGALAAGCYYVPIDRKTPAPRLREMLSGLEPGAILYPAAQKDPETLAQFGPALALEALLDRPADDGALEDRRARVLDADPAYMIFTSGSTGTPKGILVSHRAVIDFTEWMAETCGIREDDVLGNQAPFYFDLSVKDLYQTLRFGLTCYVLPQKCFMFPLLLVRALNEHRITGLIWSTSAFRLIAASGALEKEQPKELRKVILGGEALQAAHLNAWKRAAPACRFINLYGPTEVTVDCTWFPIDRDYADGEPIPIGKACRNMEVLLLDEAGRPVEPGEPGEICVRGTGLAIGYYGDWEKTGKAFVQNPLNPHYPDRLYRTGDLARLDGEGNLLFLARKDDQIKHMGYRIELGEIETALSGVEGVAEGVCLFDGAKDRILCCYSGPAEEQTVAKALLEKLPKYMQPNEYHPMETLPHTPNGKIDRPALRRELIP